MGAGGGVFAFDQGGGGDVAENEVAIAVAPFQVAGADLGVDDQGGADRAGADHVGGGLDSEGGGGAGHVHVEGEAVDAHELLDFDRDRRVGAFHVGGGADHDVDVGGGAASLGEGLGGGVDAHLGHDAGFFVAALAQGGVHDIGVEHAGLVHHVAAFDTAGLEDEVFGGVFFGGDLAGGDGFGVLEVETVRVGVEGDDEFGVGNALGGGEDPGAGDGGCMAHGLDPPFMCCPSI